MNLSEAGQNASSSQVAVDASGNATAVWRRSNGTHDRVQTAFLDTVPPPVTVTVIGQPGSVTADPSATVVFSSAEVEVTFECSLNGGAYAPCTSPHTVPGLGPGAHTVDVRATDASGNVTTQTVTWVTTATTPAPTASDPAPIVEIPSNHRCVSRRYFRIRVAKTHWPTLAKVTVQMPKTTRVLRGKQWGTIVDLRGLPKGTFTVRVAARTVTGRTIKSTRTYRTCHDKLTGSRPKL